MKRREFLKGSLAAGALAGLNPTSAGARAAEPGKSNEREYYELRVYRLKSEANQKLLDSYLEKAAFPALNRLGIKTVGAFTLIDSKEAPAVYVLIPYPSLDAFGAACASVNADPEYQKAGADYLRTAKANPAFERIDSWLMLAFAGLPKLDLPAYCRDKKPRVFEMRTYESYSEAKALKKVEMFNSGEIEVMHEVGLGPIFYGQALIGPGLPHLTYMLSAETEDLHKKHFGGFGKHPTWDKLKNDPQYANTVSKIKNWFLAPTSYSQI